MRVLIQYGYEVVRHSWLVAAFTIKYVVLGHLLLFYSRERSIEGFGDELREYARPTIIGIFLLGLVSYAIGVELAPVVPAVGEVTAFLYLAYLFWKY
jgi:hypothetical protein